MKEEGKDDNMIKPYSDDEKEIIVKLQQMQHKSDIEKGTDNAKIDDQEYNPSRWKLELDPTKEVKVNQEAQFDKNAIAAF